MNSKFIKRGIIIATVASTILIPTGQALAADASSFLNLTKQSKEVDQNALINAVAEINDITNTEKTIKIESADEIKLSDMLSGKAFATVGEEGYLIVRSTADENSESIGKVYEDSVIKVIERDDAWTKISSGNVEGFIKTGNLISGKTAIEKAKALLTEMYPETDLTTLNKEVIDNSFSVGETNEEEATRLAEEEAQRIAEEEARIAAEQARIAAEEAARQAELQAKGQAVVEYAKQFLGNPYVYGGTSLTNGTDCSGFVRAIYAHFGISMPRSSYYMRNSGYEVSYSEMMPGDVVCYSGHVVIYAGNGKIVNAIDESRGIGMSNVNYTKIITIRRMY